MQTFLDAALHYASLISAFGVVAIGIIAAAIAAGQARTARSKLRFDLYDRRYQVFEATREFLLLASSQSLADDAVTRFRLTNPGENRL